MLDVRNRDQVPGRFSFLRVPLFRLLAINLAAGIAVAALLVGGLLALDPFGLRDLIFADSDPAAALGLLLFGFVVTFGSTAMGSAIMAMGRPADDESPRGPPPLAVETSSAAGARANSGWTESGRRVRSPHGSRRAALPRSSP